MRDPKKLAVNAARRSAMLHRMGAVIVAANGFVMGKGHNTTSRGNPLAYDWSTHAEVAALRSALKKYRPGAYGKWTLYVVRLNQKGEQMLAEPCDRCRKILDGLDIAVDWSPWT
jgi:tRNA(Arg) A34 adenosine deaminase TadA